MKVTGIVRRIDHLGRLVIPKEFRRTLGINENDPMEILVTDDGILARPYKQGCICCGSTENLVNFKDISLCDNCIHAYVEKSTTKEKQDRIS